MCILITKILPKNGNKCHSLTWSREKVNEIKHIQSYQAEEQRKKQPKNKVWGTDYHIHFACLVWFGVAYFFFI